jgi:hypothetical protein
MKSNNNLNRAVRRIGVPLTRNVLASNPVLTLWRTAIGKKVVMAVTGIVLMGFVIVHMLGNLNAGFFNWEWHKNLSSGWIGAAIDQAARSVDLAAGRAIGGQNIFHCGFRVREVRER